jgi:ParB family chromosome partitioning protein
MATTKPRTPRKSKKAAPASTGLAATDVAVLPPDAARTALEQAVVADGGALLASYRDPLGGHVVVLAALPLDKVSPTPYQRDLSAAHVEKLTKAMSKVGRFLDPIIAVRQASGYWTPNGNHRLATLKSLGARTVIALLVPEAEVAYQILALNTEKAHNLKEKALEVIRMVRGMAQEPNPRTETQAAPLLDEPHLITLGACYEKRPRFTGGAYAFLLKKVDAFLDTPMIESLATREIRAEQLLSLDDLVIERVAALKRQGLDSPYLKHFVVARVNPIRFKTAKPMDFATAIEKMIFGLQKLDMSKVTKESLMAAAGRPAEEES